MKILVAIDDSTFSRNALEETLKIIDLPKATLLLLSVEEPVHISLASSMPSIFEDVPVLEMEFQSELIDIEEQRVMSVLDWAKNLCHQVGVKASTRIGYGDPKRVICRVAQEDDCDLIVVGSHGCGQTGPNLLGSVSNYVVHRAQRPVLVVRKGVSP